MKAYVCRWRTEPINTDAHYQGTFDRGYVEFQDCHLTLKGTQQVRVPSAFLYRF
jgi:hypothetical protein